MKFSIKKGVAVTLAVLITMSTAAVAMAAEKVTITHGDNTITATRTDGKANRMALAQFDEFGRLQGFSVSSALTPETVTNEFSFNPNYKTKVITFSDFETATALEEHRTLGSKTLFAWDGETRKDVSLDSNGGAHGMDINFDDGCGFGEYTDSNGNIAFRALDSTGSGFTSDLRHIHMYPESITTDWIVYSFDMTMNSEVSSRNWCDNKHVMSVILYGGVAERTPAEMAGTISGSTGAYKLLVLSTVSSGDYYTQYRVPSGIQSNGTDKGNGRFGSSSELTTIGNAEVGKKMNVQVEVNQRDRFARVYIDNELVTSVDLSDSAEGTANPFEIRALRFRFAAGTKYDITLDNMYVYEGSERRTDNISTEKVREIILTGKSYIADGSKYAKLYDDSIYTAQIGTTKAVHANTGVVWNGSRKVMLANVPFENDGKQYVPKDELASVLGMSCALSENAVERNGVTYVPVEDFLESTEYTRLTNVTDNPNCYVLKRGFNPTDANKFNHWMLFYRPTAETVLADYKASDRAGEHPRLLATQDDFDRIREWYQDYIKDDANFNAYYDNKEVYKDDGTLDEEKSEWLGPVNANSPWNRWLRSAGEFIKGRVEAIEKARTDIDTSAPTEEELAILKDANIPYYWAYDAVGRMRYQRLLASDAHILALWCNLTFDDTADFEKNRYGEALWKEIEQVITFPDFNLRHKLDVSEAQAAMAIAYDWGYHYWKAYDKANGTARLEAIEKCMHDNGLFYSWSGYQDGGMMSGEFLSTANHGTVGNNGAMMLALALIDVEEYQDVCTFIISEALKSQELNIWRWNTGAWFEGAGYWELTMQHTAKFVETLQGIFPGGYGFAGLEGLSEAGVAEVQHHTPVGIFNYGDNNHGSTYWVPELIWLADEYDQEDLAWYVWKNRASGFSTGKNWKGEDSALALLWLDDENVARTSEWKSYTPKKLGLDYSNTAIDVAIMRDTHDVTYDSKTKEYSDYTFVGLKGGCATDAHAQIDAGSFVFESDGIRWAQDPGAGSYLGGYFDTTSGGQRWKQLPARGEAHNTLIINPKKRGVAYEDQIIEARSELTGFTSNTNGAIATVDMTDVLFDVDKSVGATRGFFFTDNRQSLVVRDEFTPSASGTAYWTMMLPALGKSDSVTVSDNKITVVYNDKTLYVDYVVSGGTAETPVLTKADFQPITTTNIIDLGKTNGQIRIPVTITNGTAVGITVKLTPADVTNPTPVSNYTNGIANWSL